MPQHSWRCKNCRLEIDVIRGIKNHGDIPTEEELQSLAEEMKEKELEVPKCESHDWNKFLKSAPTPAYGVNWSMWGGSGKGNW